jgi:hypothetical protein
MSTARCYSFGTVSTSTCEPYAPASDVSRQYKFALVLMSARDSRFHATPNVEETLKGDQSGEKAGQNAAPLLFFVFDDVPSSWSTPYFLCQKKSLRTSSCLTSTRVGKLYRTGSVPTPLHFSTALRLRYVDLFVSIEVAVEVCCCFTVFSCYTAVEVQYQ